MVLKSIGFLMILKYSGDSLGSTVGNNIKKVYSMDDFLRRIYQGSISLAYLVNSGIARNFVMGGGGRGRHRFTVLQI